MAFIINFFRHTRLLHMMQRHFELEDDTSSAYYIIFRKGNVILYA
jgi:hypothetical protein